MPASTGMAVLTAVWETVVSAGYSGTLAVVQVNMQRL